MHSDSVINIHALSLHPTTGEPPFPPPSLLPDLAFILTTYAIVFNTPKQLPSPRPHEHHIHLTPGSQPANVCPYGCPQFQRTEITRLTSEKLGDGIIHHNTSPFSSHDLLVKKGRYFAILCRLSCP